MSGGLEIKYDLSGLGAISERMRAAGLKAPLVLRRAVNHTGDKATTAMRKVLIAQTGLKRITLNKAVKGRSAADGYVIRSKGGNISLKYFAARETRRGVSAAPWSKRQVYDGTFMKAGWPQRWNKRVVKPNWNGHVFSRTGGKTSTGKDKFNVERSGLFIPDEMVKGQSEAAFYGTVNRDLAPRIAHELLRILGG